jgi:hypothetical protein
MKSIRFSKHSLERCERGCSKEEVVQAIREGKREIARDNKWMSRLNFEYNEKWEGRHYAIKQVLPFLQRKKKK